MSITRQIACRAALRQPLCDSDGGIGTEKQRKQAIHIAFSIVLCMYDLRGVDY